MRLHYIQHVPFEGPANIQELGRKPGLANIGDPHLQAGKASRSG